MKKETACKIIVEDLKEISKSVYTLCDDNKRFYNKIRYISRNVGIPCCKLAEIVFWYFMGTEDLDIKDCNHLRIYRHDWKSTLHSIGYCCLVRNNSNK